MNNRVFSFLLCASAVTAVPAVGAELNAAPETGADVPDVHHGAVEGPSGPVVEGGLVATFQHASDDEPRDEATASFDLLAGLPLGPGTLTVYMEGNSSPRNLGVTSFIPDANADVGTALDADDNGRFQVSEFHYDITFGTFELYAGLLDPTGFIDTSELANDETTQFLNLTLVNNPTIEIPDYTIGAALHHGGEGGWPGLTLLVTGSHGLGDNPDRSYDQLVDLGEEGKGVFAAAELHWELDGLTPRFGLWTNTADHESLDGESVDERNAGAYGVLDGTLDSTLWNLRAGVADTSVSEAAWFLGAAVEQPVGAAALGLGVTHTALSDDAQDAAPALDDTTQAELYARFDVGAHWQVTPSIQYVRNPGFDDSGEIIDSETWVGGLRLTGTH